MKYISIGAALLTILLFSACNDESKVDRIQQVVERMSENMGKESEFRNRNTANIYILNDIARNQQLCVLSTFRTVSAGELIFIGDDIWHVETVKMFTDELPSKEDKPTTLKGYKISLMELLVKFNGKVQPRPTGQSAPAPQSPTPQ